MCSVLCCILSWLLLVSGNYQYATGGDYVSSVTVDMRFFSSFKSYPDVIF